MTCHRRCRRRACLPCVSSGDSSGYHTERKPGHTGGRDKVSPRCGFSCESSSCLTGKRTFYTWSRSKESCHCGFFGVSSSYWSGRKICHKLCRGRAVPQNGSDGVTLSLKSKKTTYDIFCSQKASLLNECGCEFLVDWSYGRSCHTIGIDGPWSSTGWELLVVIGLNHIVDTNRRVILDNLILGNAGIKNSFS